MPRLAKLSILFLLAALPAAGQKPVPAPAPTPIPTQAIPQAAPPAPPMAPALAPGPSQGVRGNPSPKAPGDVQILLDRAGFSPGVMDGRWGSNSTKALTAFQSARKLPATGKVDPATWNALLSNAGNQVVLMYTLTPDDLKGPFVPVPEEMADKAKLPALGYSSPIEMLAERYHSTPDFLQRLNPGAKFDAAGQTLRVPNVREVKKPEKGEAPPEGTQIVVSKSNSALTVQGPQGVLFYAPVSAGSEHDPLPIGDWKVKGVAFNPTFNYNPELFWDAEPGDTKAKVPAGPNNPVGVVWIDLSKEHYGIHGTPEPRMIGKSFSHGCVRLTNWDALTVAGLVKAGTPVLFRE